MNPIISNVQKVVHVLAFTSLIVITGLSTYAEKPSDNRLLDDRRKKAGDRRHHGSASTAEVTYIGSEGDSPLFDVVYHNTLGAKFSVQVQDEDGNSLFQGVYTDTDFDRKFKVLTEGSRKLVFIIRSYSDNSLQRFEVNTDVHFVEEVGVREVK